MGHGPPPLVSTCSPNAAVLRVHPLSSIVFPTPPFAAMAFRLPVIFDFGVEAQPAAGKSAEQWIASAEEERPFLFKKLQSPFPATPRPIH